MKRKTYILTSLVLTLLVGAAAIWNYSANTASAQKSEESENLGVIVAAGEYNARDEFSNTQNPNGVWSYGYSTSDADNTLNLFAFPNDSTTAAGCSGGIFQSWRTNNGDQIPQIARHNPAANCLNIPANALFMHPGYNNQRAVTRWTAPVGGTFQITGTFQKQNPSATTDLKIIKNAATAGETTLFTATIGAVSQQAFNFTITVAAGDKIDFSVGDDGNNSWQFDGSSIIINIAQPVTACLTAPANLQVFVPGENSPVDVQSINTNASLVGNATYTNMGKVGRAFEFDGDGDYVRIEDNAAQRPATAFTIEAWAKFDSTSGLPHIVSKPLRNSAFNSYALYLEGGTLRAFLGNNSGQYTRVFSNFTPQTGVWNHLAFTYNFSGGVSTLKLYANGVEVTSGQDGTANLPLFYDANPYPFLIGADFENNIPSFPMDGQADEVSIYGRALSQAEIFDLVQQGSFGKCAPGSACFSAPQGLVSWYKGEDNALDSNSLNPAALQNGTTFSTGRVGRAFSFDGTDDFVAAPDSNSLDITGDLTIEAWVNPAQIQAGSATLVDKRDPSNNNLNYVLFLVNGELRFASRSGGGAFDENFSGVTLNAGTFSHVAVTIQNGSLRFYVNGASSPALTAPATRSAATGRLIIGATETTGLSGFFNGSIDELSIYTRALSASEISSIYTAANGKCLAYVCAQPPNDLVSWFAGEQNALDSRSNNHGALFNGVVFQPAKVGQGFKFDGVDDRVEIPDSSSLKPQQITVETWVQFDSLTSNTSGGAPNGLQYLVFKKNQSVGNFEGYSLLKTDTHKLRIGFAPGNGNIGAVADSATVVTSGVFYHVVGTYDGNAIRLYVNGQLEATTPYNLPLNYDTRPVFLGTSGEAAFDGRFNGVLDETSIYSRALTATEIASIYNAGSSGKCKPTGLNPTANLVGFWTGDGDARDFAGEDQNGTLSGATFAVGKVGQAFRFTNDPQNVSIPDSVALRPTNFTIETWVKSESNSGVRHIFAKTLGSGTADSYVLWNDSGTLNAAICADNSTCNTISAPMFNTGEWHHVAFTFDDAGNTLRLYVDGVQVASGTTALSVGYDTHPALIGADYANEVISDSWRGQIDEVSLYDRALSVSEIAAVYNAGAAGKVKGKTVTLLPPSLAQSKGAKSEVLLPPASVQLSDATVSFANVTSSGTVSENGIDLGLLPPLPPSVRFTGLAYDIRATVSYQQGSADDVQVCFNLPSLAALNFANLRILHLENGAWFNRTAASNTSPVLCTDNLTSLSPFVIVESLAPTAASVSVSGRVADASGAALGGVSVSLTDSQGRTISTRSNNFGRYSFASVAAGEVYIVSVASKRYTFGVSSQAINVQDAVENVDFTADSDARRFDETKP